MKQIVRFLKDVFRVMGEGFANSNMNNMDALVQHVFGPAQVTEEKYSKEPSPQRTKTLATFSQLMTLAHNFNRKHEHIATSGCKCESCAQHRRAA